MKKLALSLAIVAFFAFGSVGMSNVVAATTNTEMAKPDEKKKADKKTKKSDCSTKTEKSECCSSKKKSDCGDKDKK